MANYINNADFLAALIDYKTICDKATENNKPHPKIPDYIGKCFIKLAENIAKMPVYNGYTFKEDMIADGIENSFLYFRNFDPTKGTSPYSYFTQIIIYAFWRRIAYEKKQLYIKYKATKQYGLLDDGECMSDDNGNSNQFEIYDNISEFIETYEAAQLQKKIIKDEKKKLLNISNKGANIEQFCIS